MDGTAPICAFENIPAKNPFSHARCSVENGALSGTKGTGAELNSAAVIRFRTPSLLTIRLYSATEAPLNLRTIFENHEHLS
jgi:hypothetical protein